MRHLVAKAGAARRIEVDSAATSRYQIGELPHYGTRQVLAAHGVPCGKHRARQLTRRDYDRYDLIIGMDKENLADILHILGSDPQHKVRMLLDWSDRPREIADPWYTGDYETTYDDVYEGCSALLAHLLVPEESFEVYSYFRHEELRSFSKLYDS